MPKQRCGPASGLWRRRDPSRTTPTALRMGRARPLGAEDGEPPGTMLGVGGGGGQVLLEGR